MLAGVHFAAALVDGVNHVGEQLDVLAGDLLVLDEAVDPGLASVLKRGVAVLDELGAEPVPACEALMQGLTRPLRILLDLHGRDDVLAPRDLCWLVELLSQRPAAKDLGLLRLEGGINHLPHFRGVIVVVEALGVGNVVVGHRAQRQILNNGTHDHALRLRGEGGVLDLLAGTVCQWVKVVRTCILKQRLAHVLLARLRVAHADAVHGALNGLLCVFQGLVVVLVVR